MAGKTEVSEHFDDSVSFKMFLDVGDFVEEVRSS